MRSPDAVAAMHHCVDLINYAANHIDTGIQQIRKGPVVEKVNQIQHQISATRDNAIENIRDRVSRARDTLQEATQVVKSIPAVIVSKTEELRSRNEQEAIPPPHLWLTSPTPQQLLDTTIDASNIAVSVLRTLSADLRLWFIHHMRSAASSATQQPAASAAANPEFSAASASHLQIVKAKLQDTVTLLNSVLHYLHSSSAAPAPHLAALTPHKPAKVEAEHTAPTKPAPVPTHFTTHNSTSTGSTTGTNATAAAAASPAKVGKMMMTSTSLLPVDSEPSAELPVAPIPAVEETYDTYLDALEHGLDAKQEEEDN